MKRTKILAVLAAAGLALTGCSNSAESKPAATASSSAHADDHKHDSVSYYAIYDLQAANYRADFGHTHEQYVHLAFVPVEDGKDLIVAGKTAMSSEEKSVKNKDKVEVTPGAVYHVKLAHYDGRVDFKIPNAGKWAVFSDIPPGNALPWKLRNDKDEILKPIEEKTLNNTTNDIYNGYFEDSQVKNRQLTDYEGDWKSVYPLLKDGSLDKVMEHKAEDGKKTKEEWKAYYEVGYQTDVTNIGIHGNEMSFTKGDKTVKGVYKYERYEILKYQKGNRGVRFLFTKTSGDEGAPKFVQFSDHNIFPVKASHFHIYMADSSHEELLKEIDHWPTYYPEKLSKDEIVQEMLGH